MDIQVEGAEQYKQLAKRLRRAGERDLLKQLNRSIRTTTKPLLAAQKRSVKALPSRGPKHTRLRARTAGATRLQVRSGGTRVGVALRVGRRADLGLLPRYMNRGKWRHRVYGMNVWVTQRMPKDWFDRPAKKGARVVRRGLVRALDDVADKIAD